MSQLALRLLVFCWGRCGGWGYREQDTLERPCDVPGCSREHGHDAPHNPRMWEREEKTPVVIKKRIEYVWRLIAVDGNGQGHGDCGHNHAAKDEAVSCKWTPEGWDELPVCDLLARQVRDRRIDPPRTKRRRAA